jgi:hypothetical protein
MLVGSPGQEGEHMKTLFVALIVVAVAVSWPPALAWAQVKCPDIVAQAKTTLERKMALNPDDIQAPRSQAGAVAQQAPRENQNIQAPRENQNVQAPRAKLTKAAALVQEAEAACGSGNTTLASQKAKAALRLLK